MLIKIKEVLNKYKSDSFINDFIRYVNNYIDTKYTYPKIYFSNSKELDLLLYILSCMINLDKEMKKREFSTIYLHDSKKFEGVEGRVVKILKDFDSLDALTNEEVLARYNIIKNSSYVLIKNKLVFKLNDQIINLDKLGFEYSLSDEMIMNLEILDSNINKVITVENLTSFYTINDDALIIYLAGFHNHTKQMLLNKIYSKYQNSSYYHFSDIDAGGFYIFNNLVSKTNIPFIPYRMDIKELETYKEYTKSLTINDKERLTKMLADNRFVGFHSVIKYMLDNNIKLEQEAITK